MKFKKVLVIFLVCAVLATGNDEMCNSILYNYKIDKKTKSAKGWERVCYNNKVNLYTSSKLTSNAQNDICSCLVSDRDKNFREISDVAYRTEVKNVKN